MPRRTLGCLVLGACACVVLTGCMPRMTIEELKAKMPERPVELDQLDVFVGKWEFVGEAKLAILEGDEPLKAKGTTEYKWDGDRWYLVGRSKIAMEPFDPMQAIETWTYDVHSKMYRNTWTDGMGGVGIGECTYDKETNTWHSKSIGYGSHGKSTMKGWMKLLDDDTMEWYFAEYMGFMKTMEMTGTGTRVQ